MTKDDDDKDELISAIEFAVRQAVRHLFSEYDGHYYYLTLITSAEANPPVLSAWSQEALTVEAQKASDPAQAYYEKKWSYAESPFLCFGKHYFSEVERLWTLRPIIHNLSRQKFIKEVDFRISCMEEALFRLDREGVFGTGMDRNGIYINVEVMPPDIQNTLRAIRLNPPEAIAEWLQEAAEA